MAIRRRVAAGAFALFILLFVSIAAGTVAFAQFGFRDGGALRGEQGDPADIPPPQLPDRDVAGCHLHYTSVRAEANGSGWRTDYPWAQRNLMIRLSEVSRTRISWKTPRIPYVWLVGLMDPTLFECPYLMASDVGTIGLSPDEVEQLRRYLEKGGFLWVDDFWGQAAWEQWSRELARALPDGYTVDEVPPSDPIFHSMFEVRTVPQVPGIGYWRRSRGDMTSERGAETAEVRFRAIRDEAGRIVSVMTHNTDVSNSWERETEDPEYFRRFSVDGYALGLNVVLYALTH